MKVLILGGDGYLGWPTALRFSKLGDEVSLVDNMLRRKLHKERGTDSLTPIRTLETRIRAWKKISGKQLRFFKGDLLDYNFVADVVRETKPNVVIHYGEIPSAPYSMIDVHHAVFTQKNNVIGTLNLIFALRDFAPQCHLIKLGTMGEYGTPNIDIEEGFLEIQHKGRKDLLPFPKQPGSFYHLSKVHDSHNIALACKIFGLRATDLNQGVVYGIDTPESKDHEDLITRFDYDESFGTVLNRFSLQAIIGHPLTPYGDGHQKRAFLNILDTLQCVRIAAENPAKSGEYRVFNQFTEVFSVMRLAEIVKSAGARAGLQVEIKPMTNPRKELQEHYYNPSNRSLLTLGLKPALLSETLITSIFGILSKYRSRVRKEAILPKITWTGGDRKESSLTRKQSQHIRMKVGR